MTELKEKSKLFKALSDPGRLRILSLLYSRPLCVCEITKVLGLAASTVSQHLTMLKEGGFIYEVKDGRWSYYHISRNPSDPRVSAILGALPFWIGENGQFNKDKTAAENPENIHLCDL